jgi:hypothetical protein
MKPKALIALLERLPDDCELELVTHAVGCSLRVFSTKFQKGRNSFTLISTETRTVAFMPEDLDKHIQECLISQVFEKVELPASDLVQLIENLPDLTPEPTHERIKRLVRSSKRKHLDLAAQCGVSTQEFKNYLDGKIAISENLAYGLCRVFKLSLVEYFPQHVGSC